MMTALRWSLDGAGLGWFCGGPTAWPPVAIKRLKDQSLEQQEVFMREMALLRGCRGSRYIVPFVGASLQPVWYPCCAWISACSAISVHYDKCHCLMLSLLQCPKCA